MMNFVRRWFFNRHRYIYTFWNGSRIAKADPMVVWRDLQRHEDFREEDFKLMKVPALRNDIIAKIAGVVRGVFDIRGPDNGGLTELECLDVLTEYIAYSGFQKKNGVQMQTSLSPTDMAVFADSTEEQNTPDDSDSISTPTELPTGQPKASQQESQ